MEQFHGIARPNFELGGFVPVGQRLIVLPGGSLARQGAERGKGTRIPGVPCSSSSLKPAAKALCGVGSFPFRKAGKGGDERNAPIRNQRDGFPSGFPSRSCERCVGSEQRHLNFLAGV